MLTAYLFDRQRGTRVEAWGDALEDLGESQLLWLDLVEPSSEEVQLVEEALDVTDIGVASIRSERPRPELVQEERHLRVTAVAARTDEDGAGERTVALACLAGENWVVTAHDGSIAVIDDFRERAEGAGAVGALDAGSFLAVLLDWVVTSYLRAFEEIEAELEEFDLRVLGTVERDAERGVGELVQARREVGGLRRSLAPHREVFVALAEATLDPISTEESARRFGKLAEEIDTALTAARDAKDAVLGSFEVLTVRTEHRTNEIMKVLTVASVLLLPGALIAGIMGMNFKPAIFEHPELFWVVDGVILLIAVATLVFARIRRWI